MRDVVNTLRRAAVIIAGPDNQRAQRIVLLAATKTKNKALRAALRQDDERTFLKMAKDMLEESAERAAAMNMSEADVDEAVALQLVMRGLDSLVRSTS